MENPGRFKAPGKAGSSPAPSSMYIQMSSCTYYAYTHGEYTVNVLVAKYGNPEFGKFINYQSQYVYRWSMFCMMWPQIFACALHGKE